jgi:hypothetical protein
MTSLTNEPTNNQPIETTTMEALNLELNKVLEGMTADGSLQKLLEKKVQECVVSALSNATRYDSPFMKGLQEYVNGILPMDFRAVSLEQYQHTILEIIRANLEARTQGAIQESMKSQLESLLEEPPKEIKVSEIWKAFRQYSRGLDRNTTCSYEVKDDGGSFWQLKLKAKSGQYDRGEYTIGVEKSCGTIYLLWLPYEQDVTKKMFVGRLYSFERLLFQGYMAKSKLVMDLRGADSAALEPDEEDED